MKQFAELWRYIEQAKPEIEAALEKHQPFAPQFIKTNFNDALVYALFPGGKRLRPALTLLGAEAVGGERKKVLAAAAAVEFVHTSSLIFDDLPCMDNAAERRGKISVHQQFGEAAAVLVGLALFNAAYGLIFDGVTENCGVCAERAMRAHAELVACIGTNGMVGGQSIDLEIARNKSKTGDFETLRNLKTSALIRMALRVGAILAGADRAQLKALSKFAELLGDAYQTSDDLIDLQEDLHISNATERTKTFALERGISAAQARISDLLAEAKTVVQKEFGTSEPIKILCLLADYVAERNA
jgi:geranylgeranyl diphosphate synthase type II